jgi:hypothetical protein
MAVGAYGEGSTASDQGAGAAYVFMRDGNGEWQQQARLVAQNGDPGDEFGIAIAISDDGNTVCVGADSEDSDALGVGGDSDNNDDSDSGAAYVFVRKAGTWTQQAYLKPSDAAAGYFGTAVDLSADGNVLAVGAPRGNGVVHTFQRGDFGAWSKHGSAKAPKSELNDDFGFSVSISSDGNALAVGAPGEASNATGIDGDETNNDAQSAGAAYVFRYDAAGWSQESYLKASNSEAGDNFGYSVALSGDGKTLAVGAYAEQSAATGINGDQADNNGGTYSGAAYVFRAGGATWRQEAYVKASNTITCDLGMDFGLSVALSNDGSVLAVGADYENSGAAGVDGDQADCTASRAGAAYLFSGVDGNWKQKAYVKAPNPAHGDTFGVALDLSDDGTSFVVGSPNEDSSSADPNDNSASEAGAVYVYEDDRRSAPSPR